MRYLIQIEDWNWSFGLGINPRGALGEQFTEHRHLHIRGRLLSPERFKVREAYLVFFSEPELDRPNWAAVEKPHIGSMEFRNRSLRALIGMPASVLGQILQMLASSRIRYADLGGSAMVRGTGDLESYLLVKELSELELPHD